jgi:hypothetical protein
MMKLKYRLDIKDMYGKYRCKIKLFNSENHMWNYASFISGKGMKVIGVEYIGKV